MRDRERSRPYIDKSFPRTRCAIGIKQIRDMNSQFTRLNLPHHETGACVLCKKLHGLDGNVEKRWLRLE